VIVEDDVPWMVALARRRYPNNFDIQAAELWFRNIVLKQPLVFLPLRTEGAFLVVLISVIPWLPTEWEANVAMICADDGKLWEAMTLVRESIHWAERRKCAKWHISSETGFDIAPMALRVGAKPAPRYRVELR
jgi:hypothetical protein